SKTLPYFMADKNLILETAKELLYQGKLENSVRLLGISLANLNTHISEAHKTKDVVTVQLKFDF
ncbi:MAG: DNA polymerase IV, partial [Eudoraea sp.]